MAELWQPIYLSAKVFGHLSQGLYRTPAGAIKELISNSFDADARLVKIHTGFPKFETFSCKDNGTGMSQEEFRRLMNRGIGSSYKRTTEKLVSDIYNRPLIGRLGLGILSLAQICTRFDIISHHKESRTAFRATIKFPPYTRQEMDKVSRAPKAKDDEESVKGGEFQIVEEKYESTKQGLRIFTEHLREPFRKRMRSTLVRPTGKGSRRASEPYKTFDAFLNTIYNSKNIVRSLNLLSDYDELLFGLALAAPLALSESRNLATQLPSVRERQKKLIKFDFRVQVDNLQLVNPVCLPFDAEGHTAQQCNVGRPQKRNFELEDGPIKESLSINQYTVDVRDSDEKFNMYELHYSNKNVAGSPLEFSGYLFQQTGRLYPRDIQGILVRLGNVAIGKYDNGMMTYPYGEGPRYAMISTELTVQSGFDDALNIDRDSFNELHPHYIRAQAYIHSLLHELIFPEAWGEEKQRNKSRRTERAKKTETRFVHSYRQATGDTVRSIERIVKSKTTPHRGAATSKPPAPSPVTFKPRNEQIEIDHTHPLLEPLFRRRRKYAPLIEKLVVAFERSNEEPSAIKRRELFYKLLSEIFSDE